MCTTTDVSHSGLEAPMLRKSKSFLRFISQGLLPACLGASSMPNSPCQVIGRLCVAYQLRHAAPATSVLSIDRQNRFSSIFTAFKSITVGASSGWRATVASKATLPGRATGMSGADRRATLTGRTRTTPAGRVWLLRASAAVVGSISTSQSIIARLSIGAECTDRPTADERGSACTVARLQRRSITAIAGLEWLTRATHGGVLRACGGRASRMREHISLRVRSLIE